MGRVSGKVAIISGAASSKGIGIASAIALLREGAMVMLTDIDGVKLAQSVALIDNADERVACMGHDVGDADGWDAVVRETVKRFGKVDILVNNAGISQMLSLADVTEADWHHLMRINLTGTFLGARAALRQMRTQQSAGSIINISSIAGLVGFEGMPAYNASKGGVRLLSKNIALEGGPQGIRCNSVHPGVIATEILQDVLENAPETFDTTTAMIPVGRLGRAEEVAEVVLFLASDASAYVTGSELVVDGGLTAR